MRPCLHVGSVVQVCGSLLFHWAHRCWITLGSAEQLATESVGGACESEIFFFRRFFFHSFFPPFGTVPLFLWRLTSSVTR